MPLLHTSFVHWLPSSAGRSESSAALMMFPAPSHWFTRQSPGVWLEVCVPDAVKLNPQAPAVQVRWRQSVSIPGHWEAVVHVARHCPALQTPLQQSESVVQNAAAGWQHAAWHVPEIQLAEQQSASTEQDAPEAPHDGRQAPETFCSRGPDDAAPGVPSPDPFVAVTMNQNSDPGAGVSVIVPDVVVVANVPSSHDSTEGLRRHGKLERSPR